MAYIGNTVQNQGFTPAIDYFNGNGVTVTFTLSRPVVSVAQMIVAIDNVIQNPSSAFTVSGNSITFTSAPLSGTNNIWVEYTSLITQYNAISQDPSVIGDITASGGYLATGDFGNTFTDGTIVDYVTGMARITTGDADGITFYNNGPSARNPLMTLGATGTLLVGTTSATSLGANSGIQGYQAGYLYATVNNDAPGGFARRGSDGNLVLFRRDTSTVGTIDVTTAGVTYTGTNGITFTATQSSSANANTLDDYEEGTWTPAVTGGFTSPAYNVRIGTYTKIGNVVTFTLRIDMSVSTRTGSTLQFSLPFTSRNTSHQAGGASWSYLYEAIGNSTTTNVPMLYVNSNSATMDCYSTTGNGFLGTDLSTTTPYFYISGSYLTP